MRKYTRGEFLGLSAALAGLAGLARLPLARHAAAQGGPRQAARVPAGVEPDLVVVNARVLTLDPALPRAAALAVKDGRFFRDPGGEPNGLVAEEARAVFARVGKREEFTPEQRRGRARNGMRHISELLTAAGLTSVHDAGADRDRILGPAAREEHDGAV